MMMALVAVSSAKAVKMWVATGATATTYGATATTYNALAQADLVAPASGLLEGGLAIAIAASFFGIVAALVSDKIVSSKASERIAREAAEHAVREYIERQRKMQRGEG